MATDTSAGPLHFLVFDAHHGVLGHEGYPNAEVTIDAIIARLKRAKLAHLAGDKVAASREFDPRYEVKS